jgi:DNA-binding IclR family transcriptional regulator
VQNDPGPPKATSPAPDASGAAGSSGPAGARGDRRPYLIESVDNALRLLLLVRERRAVRVAEAADHLGVARSTAHRLLTGLRYRGFLIQDSHRVYRPGPVFAAVGLAAAAPDLRLLARPHLQEINAAVDETVHLLVLEGNGVRFVEGMEGTKALRVGTRVGVVLPAHCTAGGLVLLAALPSEEVTALYPRGLPTAPGDAITELPALRRRLRTVRRAGYGTNSGESERGISAVAVPVSDPDGHTIASLAIAMPSARCPRTRAPELATLLHGHARSITASL